MWDIVLSDERKRERRTTDPGSVDGQNSLHRGSCYRLIAGVCSLLLHCLSGWLDSVRNRRSTPTRSTERGSEVAQRELEGRTTSFDSALLPIYQEFSGKGGGICWHENPSSASKDGCSEPEPIPSFQSKIGTGVLMMPSVTIGPDEHVRLKYNVPKSRLVEFEIDADRPVKSYILGPKALMRFSEGSETFKYYGGFPDPRATQRQTVRIPFSGSWYLVIMNPNKRHPVEVEYEVYY